MDEMQLLKRLKDREESALEELMEEYENLLTGIVSRILLPYMSREDVAEVVSDTFYSLWSHVENIDLGKGSIRAYLTASARNHAKNKFRGYRGDVPLQENDTVEVPDVCEHLEKKERERMIGEALGCLKAEEREILVRYYFWYQSTGEIAESMGIRINTVKSRLRRGRKKLEIQLRERGI